MVVILACPGVSFMHASLRLPNPFPLPLNRRTHAGDFHKSAIEFSKLVHLEVLNLGHNKLRGHIPPELCMVERLKELCLNDNFLTGPVPEFLSKMPR